MFNAWLVKDNPIARLTGVTRRFADVPAARALDRAAPWIGLVLVTMLFFHLYDTLRQSSYWQPYIYGSIAQIIWLVDLLITVRLLWEGMSAGQRLRGHTFELIAATPVSGVRLLFWTGRTALAGAWGWVIVLLWIYVLYGLTIAIGSVPSSTLLRLVSALSFAVINCALSVVASVVIGSAVGLRFRSGYTGLIAAIALLYIPFMLIVLLTLSDRTPYYFTWSHLFVVDTHHRTFIAIGDSGLLALYRVAGDTGWHTGRSVLAALITLHTGLLMIALGSLLFLHTLRPFNWHSILSWYRKLSVQGTWRTALLPIALFAATAIGMVWLWTTVPRVLPDIDTPPFPMVQRDRLRLMQVMLAGILVGCTLIAMRAGMIAARSQPIGTGIVRALSHMRGWGFGLSLLLMIAALLTILDHQIDGYGRSVFFADPRYSWRWGMAFRIEYPHAARWHILQPVAALAWAIIMGWGVIASGIVLGVGAAKLWRRPADAWAGAIVLRAVPVLVGILPPNIFTLPHPGLLAARMNADPLFAIADSGLTVLLGVIDPAWTYEDFCGQTLLSIGAALGVLTFCVNAAVALLPLAIVFFQRRARHTD
jgi:hypothetical protein